VAEVPEIEGYSDLVEVARGGWNLKRATAFWVKESERHEALPNRAVVKGHCRRSVAADWFTQRVEIRPGRSRENVMYIEQIAGLARTRNTGATTARRVFSALGTTLKIMGAIVVTLLRVLFKAVIVVAYVGFRMLVIGWRIGVRFLEAL